jgi:large subunit ribosomal protein L24
MQQKRHVKKGDEVIVLSGSERGKSGKIIQVLPKKNRVLVEGVNMIKRHVRRNQQQPQGAIVEREGSIHISNVALASGAEAKGNKA